jgi:hypothetical protein
MVVSDEGLRGNRYLIELVAQFVHGIAIQIPHGSPPSQKRVCTVRPAIARKSFPSFLFGKQNMLERSGISTPLPMD